MIAWLLALLAWFALIVPVSSDGVPPPVAVEPGPPISVSPLPPVDVEPVEPGYPVVSPPSDGIVVSPPDDGSGVLPGHGFPPPIHSGVSDPGEGRALVLAPIEDLSFVVRESYPPQYVLQVTSALPNGCAAFEGYTFDRQGGTISIEVWNSTPTQSVPCTMQYGYHPFTIELGTDFTSGQQVTVIVNDRVLTFTAQ